MRLEQFDLPDLHRFTVRAGYGLSAVVCLALGLSVGSCRGNQESESSAQAAVRTENCAELYGARIDEAIGQLSLDGAGLVDVTFPYADLSSDCLKNGDLSPSNAKVEHLDAVEIKAVKGNDGKNIITESSHVVTITTKLRTPQELQVIANGKHSEVTSTKRKNLAIGGGIGAIFGLGMAKVVSTVNRSVRGSKHDRHPGDNDTDE